MRNIDEMTVDGLIFRSIDDADIGREEITKIKYLNERMDSTSPEKVLHIYNKILQNRLFKTPIGIGYLIDLRKYLKKEYKGEEKIADIMLHTVYERKVRVPMGIATEKIKKSDEIKKKDREQKSLLLNIVLALVIIAMFFISLNGKNPTILNYEEAIINKYARWEAELDEREEKLRVLERK